MARRNSQSARARPVKPLADSISLIWFYAVLIGAVLLTYGRIVQHDFVAWDDDGHITDNPHLDPVSWQSLVRFWREPYFQLYVPVSYTFFTAEAWLAQTARDEFDRPRFNPAFFHAGSVLLHLACVLLAWRLLLMILQSALGACIGALFFALHPLQVESVAWISEQRGLVGGAFSLLSIIAWLKFGAGVPRETENRFSFQIPAVQGATGGWSWYCLATVAYLLALLAKPSSVCIPLIAAVLDLFLLGRSWRVSALALIPWLALAAGVIVVTKHQQPDAVIAFLPPLWTRPFIAGDALQFYLTKLVWPFDLLMQYPRSPLIVLAGQWIYFAWLVPAAVLLACFYRRRNGPWLVCAGWFLAALAPVLGLAPFGYQHYSTVADRYVYLTLVAPALALGWWIRDNPSRMRLSVAAVGLLFLGLLSFEQSGRWKNNEALFSHTLRLNPRSDAAHGNWGAELLRRGRYAEALQSIEESFRLHPDTQTEKIYLNRGLALLSLGRLDEAIEAYEKTLTLFPRANPAHSNLGAAYLEKQDWTKAIHHCRAALAVEPESFPSRFNLALALQRQGNVAEGIVELRTILEKSPNQFEARMKLGTLLMQRDEFDEALRHFSAAVESQPDHRPARLEYAHALARAGQGDRALAQYRLLLAAQSPEWPAAASHSAWLMATSSTADVRHSQAALSLAQAACQKTQFQDPVSLRSLAAAQAAAGQLAEAQATASQAQELARSANNERLVAALAGDVREYQRGLPLRHAAPLSPDAGGPQP